MQIKEYFRGFSDEEIERYRRKYKPWWLIGAGGWKTFIIIQTRRCLGLGREYSQNPEFARFFRKIYTALPEFLTSAIEYFCARRSS